MLPCLEASQLMFVDSPYHDKYVNAWPLKLKLCAVYYLYWVGLNIHMALLGYTWALMTTVDGRDLCDLIMCSDYRRNFMIFIQIFKIYTSVLSNSIEHSTKDSRVI